MKKTKQKFNKFKAIKTNGYDSKKEARRAEELKILKKNGYISDLEEQKKFELQPSFKICSNKPPFKPETIRSINYIADFYYYDNEKKIWVVEDSKGFRTKEYIIKSKMFRYIYKDILFIES
jgi:ribosomal protein S8